jgi:hypothetical protein
VRLRLLIALTAALALLTGAVVAAGTSTSVATGGTIIVEN